MTALMSKEDWLAHVTERLKDAHRISVLAIDLDHLRRFHDIQGHSGADKAIRMVADVIAHYWTQQRVPCRWGGEEFTIAVFDEEFKGLAENIRATVEKKLFPDFHTGQPVGVTVSIGVGTRQSKSEPLETVLTLAEEALKQAKEAGRNCVRVLP